MEAININLLLLFFFYIICVSFYLKLEVAAMAAIGLCVTLWVKMVLLVSPV